MSVVPTGKLWSGWARIDLIANVVGVDEIVTSAVVLKRSSGSNLPATTGSKYVFFLRTTGVDVADTLATPVATAPFIGCSRLRMARACRIKVPQQHLGTAFHHPDQHSD